jgi:hypothetical protein
MTASAIDHIREVVLERGEQKRQELAFQALNTHKRPVFQQLQKKTLGQVLCDMWRMPPAPSEHV